MKTEDLKAQGLTDEQIAFVMAENGKDINREKVKADGLEELRSKKVKKEPRDLKLEKQETAGLKL